MERFAGLAGLGGAAQLALGGNHHSATLIIFDLGVRSFLFSHSSVTLSLVPLLVRS